MNEKRSDLLDKLKRLSAQLEERAESLPVELKPLVIASAEKLFTYYWDLANKVEGFTPEDSNEVVRLNKYFERIEDRIGMTDEEFLIGISEFKTKYAELIINSQVFCLHLKRYFLREPNPKGRAWLTHHEMVIRDAIKNAMETEDYFSGDYLYLSELLVSRKEHIKNNYHVPIDGFCYSFPFDVRTYEVAVNESIKMIDEALSKQPSPKYCTLLQRTKKAMETATKNFLANAVDGFLHEGQDYQMRIYLGAIKSGMDFIMTHPTQAEFNRVDGIRETNRVKAMLTSEI